MARVELDYPFDDQQPDTGEFIEVADGINWLRMPLPFDLDHINLWLLEDGDGWAIVDSGLGNNKSKDIWRKVCAQIGAVPGGGRPVTRVFATHFHPDHMGLAGWHCEEHEVELWTTRTEWMMARSLYLDTEGANRREMAEFYLRNGVPQAWYDRTLKLGNTYREIVEEPPARFHRVSDGESFEIGGRSWHAAYYCAEIDTLISGDHVLPRISPNISLWASEPEADPLGDYLTSLEKFKALPAGTLVLPSHVQPFRGLHERAAELQDHHHERLGAIAEAMTGKSLTGYEAIPILFGRQYEEFQLGLAMGECLAHLARLREDGKLSIEDGGDGLRRYAG
jgi:glyoxylase-like metal-dependent hydrolase (beta-lactamase superfamily II)